MTWALYENNLELGEEIQDLQPISKLAKSIVVVYVCKLEMISMTV